MKKLLPLSLIGALLPALAFAAYNDVTLGSSVVISVAGQSFNVEGDSNVVESVNIEGDTFSFILQPGSTLKVSSPTFNQIESNAPRQFITDSACETNSSFIKHSSTADSNISVTILPKAAHCPAGSNSSSSGPSSGGGSSSGGGGATVKAVTPVTIPANATVSQLQALLNSLLSQLNALKGTPQATPPGLVTAAKVHITQILNKGSRGESVRGLQQFLNSHGFIISASGAGSPGSETDSYGSLTEKAVGKFQEKYNIAKPGEPGYGRLGPKTLAKYNELSQ